MCRFLAFIIGVLVLLARAEGAEITAAGALAKNGKWEVSVDFPADVARNSAVQTGNYSFPGAASISIEGLRYIALDNAVVLTVAGLVTNDLYSVKIENLSDTSGKALPAVTVSFMARAMSWAAVGAQELGLPADAVAVGQTGFDLISGASEMWGTYDESTFAFEIVNGNFDKKVRINSQEGSSAAARAGLMVREALDEGRPRPADPTNLEEAFSRYLQVHVNPATTAFGEPGDNLHQINIRYYTGGIGSTNFDATENPVITNNVAPPYTNAWVRLRRIGEVFEAFRGNDGTNWISLGSFRFPTNDASGNILPKFASTVYIGPNYSPEVANIPESAGARRSFMAQFREYGDTGLLPVEPPTLTIARVGTDVRVQWEGGGTLQSNTNLATSIWTDLPGVSPVLIPLRPEKKQEYFRVRVAQ